MCAYVTIVDMMLRLFDMCSSCEGEICILDQFPDSFELHFYIGKMFGMKIYMCCAMYVRYQVTWVTLDILIDI